MAEMTRSKTRLKNTVAPIRSFLRMEFTIRILDFGLELGGE